MADIPRKIQFPAQKKAPNMDWPKKQVQYVASDAFAIFLRILESLKKDNICRFFFAGKDSDKLRMCNRSRWFCRSKRGGGRTHAQPVIVVPLGGGVRDGGPPISEVRTAHTVSPIIYKNFFLKKHGIYVHI